MGCDKKQLVNDVQQLSSSFKPIKSLSAFIQLLVGNLYKKQL